MDLSTNQASEYGSTRTTPDPIQPKSKLNAFDLVKVGLSSTFAISVFIGIGYVVKHVAGPSAILSIFFAAFIAYLAGIFYTELNTTIILSAIKTPERLSQVMVTPPRPIESNSTNNDPEVHNNHVETTKFNGYSHWMLSSYEIAYICHGEFAAFLIAWNLVMECIVIVALISKALILFLDVLFYGPESHLTQIIAMPWILSQNFDLLALLVPIVIGVPLMLILGRNTILNIVSIALTMVTVVILVLLGVFNADFGNWNRASEAINGEETILGTGGFFAFGIDGMFKGVVTILFMFIAFDVMIMSRWMKLFWLPHRQNDAQTSTIEHFNRTITTAILSINTAIFICLLGMALVLTTVQPVYALDQSLPLMSVVDAVFSENDGMRVATRIIILIAGFIALVGSLYAMLHGVHRVLETMLSTDADDSTFKLFGKFGLNHLQEEIRQQYHHPNENTNWNSTSISTTNNNTRVIECNQRRRQRWQTGGCLLFSILSGLLAGLFDIEHLINLLSIGTLVMLFALTIDIMILRYSVHLKQLLHHPEENGAITTTTKTATTMTMTTTTTTAQNKTKLRLSISLLTILLSVYCLLAAVLSIFIKIAELNAVPISTTVYWIFISILIASLVTIVLVLGAQPKGNAIFELNLSHPLLPAAVLFTCIYLCTAIDVAAWIRLAIWTIIGIIFYLFTRTLKSSSRPTTNGVTNDGFSPDNDRLKPPDIMISSVETLELNDTSSIHSCRLSPTEGYQLNTLPRVANSNDTTDSPNKSAQKIDIAPKMAQVTIIKTNIECVQMDMEDIIHSPLKELDLSKAEFVTEIKPLQRSQLDLAKLNEISSVEEIKNTCIERREPNGTTYFVEVNSIQNSSENAPNDGPVQRNCEFEKKMLDRIFTQNDSELKSTSSNVTVISLKSKSQESEDDEEEEEKEVRAIVHTPNTSLANLDSQTMDDELEKPSGFNEKEPVSVQISRLMGWKLGGSEEKLHSSSETLHGPSRDLHDSREELQGRNEQSYISNEKIYAPNELIQASNELLEDPNELIQASNESLQVPNGNSSDFNQNIKTEEKSSFDTNRDSDEIFQVMHESIEILDDVLDALDDKLSDSSEKSSISNIGAVSLASNANITVSDSNVTVINLTASNPIVPNPDISNPINASSVISIPGISTPFISNRSSDISNEEISIPYSNMESLSSYSIQSVPNSNQSSLSAPKTNQTEELPKSKTVPKNWISATTSEKTAPGVIRPIDPSGNRGYAKRLPNFQMGIYEAIPRQKLLYQNDTERMAFKMRLENLFNQDDEKGTFKRPKSTFNSPTAIQSQRMFLNHSTSAPESLIMPNDNTEPSTPIIDVVDKMQTPSSQIPSAPAFNQQLYDTIGRRTRKVFSSVSDVIDIDSTKNDHVTAVEFNKKGNLSRTKAHENLTELDADDSIAVISDQPHTIQQKLEQILSKSRTTTMVDPLDLQRNSNENIRRNKPHEPFDTVRRQKMLFSDVLKSIGPDIHANLHQTHGVAAEDMKETMQRRDSLD